MLAHAARRAQSLPLIPFRRCRDRERAEHRNSSCGWREPGASDKQTMRTLDLCTILEPRNPTTWFSPPTNSSAALLAEINPKARNPRDLKIPAPRPPHPTTLCCREQMSKLVSPREVPVRLFLTILSPIRFSTSLISSSSLLSIEASLVCTRSTLLSTAGFSAPKTRAVTTNETR